MGSLKQRTVQPRTRARYSAGLDAFVLYLERGGLALPTKREDMDGIVSDYLEFLRSEGESRATAFFWQHFKTINQN